MIKEILASVLAIVVSIGCFYGLMSLALCSDNRRCFMCRALGRRNGPS